VSVPQDYLDRPVAVIGAGTLGRRIALMFATRGGLVRINARNAEKGAAAVDFVERQIDGLRGNHPGSFARGRAEFVARLEDAVAGAWLVIESVPERLELKQEIFARLEAVAPRDAILASNSSSYASRLIVAGLSTTERMLNTHFYMPPKQIAVDVMSCGNTSQEVLDFVLKTFPGYGLRPFLVRRESTGFIFNRIWAAIKRESLDVVASGVATPQDVDEMWKLLFGTQIGPFRAMDRVGLDVVYDIEEHYAAENPTLPVGPRNLLRHYVDAGKLGIKTGEGFYADYPKPEPQD
jgi:3-hydroxybutyryl-CoA dehydrogenase